MSKPATPQAEPRERRFRLPAFELAALEWGEPDARPVLALHGWLDNAGSFRLLAPKLAGCHVVALDAAGHGKSGNRSPDAGYNIWQDLSDILDVTDALGWQRFNLLGHSRGAAVATLFAGAWPGRIERMVLIEGGLPIVAEPAHAAENLAEVLERSRTLRGKAGRVFAERSQAIAERARGFTPVTTAAAEILAERSLRQVEGGWQWHADQRLKAGSELRFTRDLLRPFLERIGCPVQIVMAEESPFADSSLYAEMLEAFPALERHRLPGRHHLHLEGAENEIARLAGAFLHGS